MIGTIKNLFNSSWTFGVEFNPSRWRMVARCPAFNFEDVEMYIVVGPFTLKIDLIG